MTDMLMVYITCKDLTQAKEISKDLLSKRLAACANIYENMTPLVLWPPKAGIIDEGSEITVIAKTIESKYQALEDEIHAIHTYEVPCMIAMPVAHVSQKYYDWLVGELT